MPLSGRRSVGGDRLNGHDDRINSILYANVRGTLKELRMKRIFLAVAILVAPSFLAFGQTSHKRTGNDDEARRQVLATDDRRMEALRQGNPVPLRQIYADDYTLVTPSGVIRSKDDQINDLVVEAGQIWKDRDRGADRSSLWGRCSRLVAREVRHSSRRSAGWGRHIFH